MKYDMICVEGIDKTCKDLIIQVVCKLTNFKYVFVSRGLISMLVYAKKFNREYQYNEESVKHIAYVYISTEKLDWEIRCKMSREERIDFENDNKLFDETIEELKQQYGDEFKLAKFNISHESVYDIAVKIAEYMKQINDEV